MGSSKSVVSQAASPFTAQWNALTKSFKPGDQIQPQSMDPLSPQARGLSNDLVNYSRQILNRPTSATGRFAALTPGEMSVLGALQNNIGTMSTMGQPLLSDIFSGSRMTPASNPFLSETLGGLKSQAADTLGTNMNFLDAMFNKSGMSHGSGRSNEAIELARRSGNDLNSQIANLLFGQYNQGANEQMQALGLLPSLNSSNTNSILSSLSALALPRQLEQQALDFSYNAPVDNAMAVAQILGGLPGFQFTTPQFAPSQGAQILGSLGPLMQGAGTLIGAF